MKRWMIGVLTGCALVGGAVGAGAANAAVQPNFTCPGNTVCLFQTNNFTGGENSLVPGVDGNKWLSTTVVTSTGGKVHAGSVNDNTTSIIWVYNKSNGSNECLGPGKHSLNGSFGFIQIKPGVTNCKNSSLPMPLP